MPAFKFRNAIGYTALSLLLAACSGGDSGCHAPYMANGKVIATCTGSSTTTPSVASLTLTPDCSGINCGSSNADTYSGSGVGIWSNTNSSAQAITGSINLNGVAGKSVTLLWTNTTSTASTSAPASSYIAGNNGASDAQQKRLAADKAAVKQQLPKLLRSTTGLNAARAAISPRNYIVGASNSWYDSANDKTITVTLQSQGTLSNGNAVNIWVQDSEWNTAGGSFKVTQAMADLLRDKFAAPSTGIYDMVTTLAGSAPWGAHTYTDLIPATQDIQIVVSNLTPDQKPNGLLGYFHSLNNFLKTTGSSFANSNEALMFFVDSETLASPSSTYQPAIVSALAHEFVHMINFYQRTVLQSTATQTIEFDSWLEEISAMMMQDILDPRLDASYRNIIDSWFPGWLGSGASSNCSLTAYADSGACFSYDIGGSYGGYLLRQYGLDFYKELLQSTEADSITALGNLISKYDSSANFGLSVRRWGAAVALLDSSALPAKFGYPAYAQTVGGISYALPALNGPDFSSWRTLANLPASLNPYAHAAQLFTSSSASYSRTVTIPAGSTLTVIVN